MLRKCLLYIIYILKTLLSVLINDDMIYIIRSFTSDSNTCVFVNSYWNFNILWEAKVFKFMLICVGL